MNVPVRNAYRMLQEYGISLEQFERLYLEQDGRCAICSDRMLNSDCHVDHDHEVGNVRALLCGSCNRGLGMFKDNIRRLARAIVYLEEHGKEFA